VTAAVSFNTPDLIIQQALTETGELPLGQAPPSERYAFALNRLNMMINHWQTSGLKLWLQSEIAITPVVGVGAYNLGPGGTTIGIRPMRVLQAVYQDVNNVRRPLIPLSRDEWTRLSLLQQNGAINSYFVDKQQTNLIFNIWYQPDATAATGTVRPIIQGQVTNFTGINDTMNFPIEWGLALTWGLADELSGGQPQTIMERCAQRAKMYKMEIENWDVEDASTMFTPDQRAAYAAGSFR
jgi:hypothetical protein